MDFRKFAGQLIFVSVLWEFALSVPVDQAGDSQLEREEPPGRQFGGFLVEHPDFPGRPVFLRDPPDTGDTTGKGPVSLLSEFGLDIPNFPSLSTKPSAVDDANADADIDVEEDTEEETEEDAENDSNVDGEAQESSAIQPVRRRDEEKNKNSYQQQYYRPQYRPQNRPHNRPQNRPHRPQNWPQQAAPQYVNRPQYEKPRPQPAPEPHYVKPEHPEPHYAKPEHPEPHYEKPKHPEPHGAQEYEAFVVKFPGYGHYIILAEPGTVGGHSSPFQLVNKPMGVVTLYPKATKNVQVKTDQVEAPSTTTTATTPLKKDDLRDKTLVDALYGSSEKEDEATKEPLRQMGP